MPIGQILRMATLYRDTPQRHYRQVSAVDRGGTYFVRIDEGTVKRKNPIEVEKTASREILCSTSSEAFAVATEHIEAARQGGWSDYNPIFDYWDNE